MENSLKGWKYDQQTCTDRLIWKLIFRANVHLRSNENFGVKKVQFWVCRFSLFSADGPLLMTCNQYDIVVGRALSERRQMAWSEQCILKLIYFIVTTARQPPTAWVTPLDIVKDKGGHFFMACKPGVLLFFGGHQGILYFPFFFCENQTISFCDHGNQNSDLEPNHDVFLDLTKWFWYVILTRVRQT